MSFSFHRVGQRDQRAFGGLDHRRLVVIDPVADVLHAGLGQQLRRVERLRQARPEPADRPRAGELLDHVHRAVDHRRLIVVLVDRQLVVGVAHELPAVLLGLLGDARIVLADAGVGGERGLDAEALEQFVEAPAADPHAVFVPAPVRHVGQQHLPGRRRDDLPRHRAADVPDLVVDDGPEHDARVVRQLQRRRSTMAENSARSLGIMGRDMATSTYL